MTKTIVRHENGTEAELVTDPETGETHYLCACGIKDTDRGDFADTAQAAEIHLEMRCALTHGWTWQDTGSGPGFTREPNR
jgi:hypothetical protein